MGIANILTIPHLEENISTEFKEVKGHSAIKSIISVVDQYIVAFLNNRVNKLGRILWGISDDRIVKGVSLSYKEKDKLRREISNKISQINPHVPLGN